jgi:hypothetical protein
MTTPLPFPDEWFPEDDTVNEDYPEERTGEVFRVVGQDGKLDGRNTYYETLKGAKAYMSGHWAKRGSRIQKGEVTWSELD